MENEPGMSGGIRKPLPRYHSVAIGPGLRRMIMESAKPLCTVETTDVAVSCAIDRLVGAANLAKELAVVCRLLHDTTHTDREESAVFKRYREAMDQAKTAGLL